MKIAVTILALVGLYSPAFARKKPGPLAKVDTACIPGSVQHSNAVQMYLWKAINGRLRIVPCSQAQVVLRVWEVQYKGVAAVLPLAGGLVVTPSTHYLTKLTMNDEKSGALVYWEQGAQAFIVKNLRKALAK
jgi:hypothetical protein